MSCKTESHFDVVVFDDGSVVVVVDDVVFDIVYIQAPLYEPVSLQPTCGPRDA